MSCEISLRAFRLCLPFTNIYDIVISSASPHRKYIFIHCVYRTDVSDEDTCSDDLGLEKMTFLSAVQCHNGVLY